MNYKKILGFTAMILLLLCISNVSFAADLDNNTSQSSDTVILSSDSSNSVDIVYLGAGSEVWVDNWNDLKSQVETQNVQTIYLYEGTYMANGVIKITRNVNIIGTGTVFIDQKRVDSRIFQTDDDSKDSLTTIDVPEITIDKIVSDTVPNYGDEIVYGIDVENIGDVAADNVVITDFVPEGLIVIEKSISNNGTYDKETRVITWIVNVSQLESLNLTYEVSVNSTGYLTNIAVVGNYTDNETIHVPKSDVGIEIFVPNVVTVGDIFDIIIKVTNYGPAAAENIRVFIGSNGVDLKILNILLEKGLIVEDFWGIDNLNCNESADLILTVKALNSGNLTIIAIISTTFDYNLSNNIAEANVTVLDKSVNGLVAMKNTGNPLVLLVLILFALPFINRKFKK